MSDRLDNNHPVSGPVATQAEPAGRTVLSDRVRSLRLGEQQTRRSLSVRAVLPWVLCVVLAGLAGYLGYRAYVAGAPAETDQSPGAKPSASQSASTAAATPQGKTTLVAGGYVIPVQRVQFSPKVGGEVIELRIKEGQLVEKGEVLARLDGTKYQFEYRRLAAFVEQAKAEYEKLQAGNRPEEIAQAEAAFREAEEYRDQLSDERTRLIRSRSAASAEELYRVDSRLRQAGYKTRQLEQAFLLMHKGWRSEDIEKAKQAYLQAVEQRDNAKYDLDCTEVRAPVRGIILVKRAEVGNTVRPEAFSNGLSASLCDMADLTKIEVDVDVSERDLASVWVGQQCEVRTEAPSDTVYQGKVALLMPEANRSKASVSARVQIEVPPGDKHLRPEMRARVTFLAREKDGAASAK